MLRNVSRMKVTHFLFLTLFLFGIDQVGFAQNDSGIFLTIKCTRGIPRVTSKLNGKQVCLASNPIINPTEFESVSQVKQEGQTIYFDLRLSEKAVIRLNQLVINLPDATFALVVDKSVFSIFPADQLSVNRTFRFEGKLEHQNDFFNTQERLDELIGGAPN